MFEGNKRDKNVLLHNQTLMEEYVQEHRPGYFQVRTAVIAALLPNGLTVVAIVQSHEAL